MSPARTDRYWARIKLAIGVPAAGFALAVVAMGTLPAGVEGSEVSFSTYPLRNLLMWVWLLSLPFAGITMWHSIPNDKRELAKDYPDVNRRHWLTVGVFSYFSAGLYPLWYAYARYRRTKGDAAEGGSVRDALWALVPSTLSGALGADGGGETPSTAPAASGAAPSQTGSGAVAGGSRSAASDARAAVEETVERADSLRTEAGASREAGDYDRAFDVYGEARDAYQDALEAVEERDLGDRVDAGAIERRLDAVEERRRTVHHRRLAESLRSDLDKAESLAEAGELERAREHLEDVESRLTSTRRSAEKHGYDELYDEIAALEERRETLSEAISSGRETRAVPEEIPRAPSVSVEYDALTDTEPIGGGGNADVRKARLPTADGDVTLAIKEPRLSGTLHTEQVERLLQEAETWDKLDDHDHVVGVVDYGSTPVPWIAMEYMDGGHLGERSGESDLAQALWTAIAVTRGVRHAHRRGIAHLDLKPENVLFRSVEGAWDAPKIADWGLSKHLLDHSKSIEGYTPTYSAPEQLEDGHGKADDITDVYQLGAVFYELFTGQPPFAGDTTGKVIWRVLNEEPTPPSEVADVPEALDDVLLTALTKEKDDRYEDILLLRNALQDLYEAR